MCKFGFYNLNDRQYDEDAVKNIKFSNECIYISNAFYLNKELKILR